MKLSEVIIFLIIILEFYIYFKYAVLDMYSNFNLY